MVTINPFLHELYQLSLKLVCMSSTGKRSETEVLCSGHYRTCFPQCNIKTSILQKPPNWLKMKIYVVTAVCVKWAGVEFGGLLFVNYDVTLQEKYLRQ